MEKDELEKLNERSQEDKVKINFLNLNNNYFI